MTSLIDVIFLLLLFFMLSSTFSKFGDVELHVGTAGAEATQSDRLLFLQLEEDSLSLNGITLTLPALATQFAADQDATLVVSVQETVTAQRMTDLLVALRDVPEARVVLLGQS